MHVLQSDLESNEIAGVSALASWREGNQFVDRGDGFPGTQLSCERTAAWLRVNSGGSSQNFDGIASVELLISIQVIAGNVPSASGIQLSQEAEDDCGVSHVQTLVGIVVANDQSLVDVRAGALGEIADRDRVADWTGDISDLKSDNGINVGRHAAEEEVDCGDKLRASGHRVG